MSLASIRRRSAPVALLVFVTLVSTSRGARAAPRATGAVTGSTRVHTPAEAIARAPARPTRPDHVEERARDAVRAEASTAHPARVAGSMAAASEAVRSGGTAAPVAQALPTGVDKTGVSSQAISVPQGAGKSQGMGESFSAQLSTGAGSFTVPFALPAARGDAQPSLRLSYSSAAGHGVAGVGWDVGVPYIARQTDRGLPQYDDRDAWHANQDRFVFSGGQELVPICSVVGSSCTGALPSESMPGWANGWQYFRPRVEGGFLRFFWSPDHRSWRVQSKTGESLELGAPLDGTTSTGAIEIDPSSPERVFRWNLSRQYDAEGAANPGGSEPPRPVNGILYRYTVDGATAYLTDIYDTPPISNAAFAEASTYAHHTRLTYEPRPDVTSSYRRGWRATQALRLSGVDVTSKPFDGGPSAPRALVRRYHLSYDPAFHLSLLAQVQTEGRCAVPPVEGAGESLPRATGCSTLPAVKLGYQHVVPYDAKGASAPADLAGFEGFDERVIAMTDSPPSSLDEEMTDLFDVNADGLPDVLVTSPALYRGMHGLFFNGVSGREGAFTASTIAVSGVLGEDASTITLRNANVSAGDLDGDGIVDLAHMPQAKVYSAYTPELSGGGWMWRGRSVAAAAAQSPKFNLTRDAANVRRVDVNGDGLVDVVVTTGTEIETFFALGKLAGGDGQFGNGRWTSGTTASISNDPVATCVPWAGDPVRFSDPEVRLADMNGDGLPDIVRIRRGDVRYWPGRGNGAWGTGTLDCAAGTFAADRDVAMATSPEYSDPGGGGLRIDDVNGDGLDDLVQVRFQDVDVWLNVDGSSWSPRHTIAGTPVSSAITNRVRLVDINGSGTRDILWGDGNRYRYIDLSGGARPWVLNHVSNGLGKTTDIEYASSTSLMLAARAAGTPWQSFTPMPVHVVAKVIESDNLHLIGRTPGLYVTEYTYADPVYDGRQREFRGFRRARATRLGDGNDPTSSVESTFLLGECKDEAAASALPSPCSFEGRWRDNPREALKGLPVITDAFDETGTHLSTAHHTYRLRHLYAGLDGREVRHAFEATKDSYLYDTSTTDRAATAITLGDVELELEPPTSPATAGTAASAVVDASSSVALHGASNRVRLQSRAVVDAFGNATEAIDAGCVEGCTPADDVITSFSVPERPAGDPTGWLWRTGRKYVTGSSDGTARHSTATTFDAAGKPLQTQVTIAGTLPLDRFNEEATRAVAPAPPGASKDGTWTIATTAYDAFGNGIRATAANGRCRAMGYDAAYGQLVTSETVQVGVLGADGCGATTLTSSAEYDRGLAAPVAVRDLHGELSTVEYDDLGRLVRLFKPDPGGVGRRAPLPSLVVEYFLPASDATPYTRVHTRAQDGLDPGDASYRESWAFSDGLGRTLLTLEQADPGAGDGAAWVARGLSTYDSKGAVERAYLPWFSDTGPDDFDLATVPPSLYERQRYDAFGRQVQTFGLDGSVLMHTVYHSLSVDKWDAADLEPGPHQGSYASAREDGHGRTVSATERIHGDGKLEAHEIRTQYLPSGEVVTVSRVRLGSSDAPVVRWMRYDTAGRMVLNAEPDSSRGFSPDPATDASSIKAWRYAYDDAGDLVGTSDARGCGENFHYDAGGRIVAEDYSPCTREHPAYTPFDPLTGEGAEVWNRYDVADPDAAEIPGLPIDATLLAGRLVSTADRASKTILQHDGRGRTSGIARRLARPLPGASPATGSYAPRWYVKTVAFDGADRVRSESSGVVDRPVPGGSAALDVRTTVTTDYTKRGVVRSVGSNFGTLVRGAVHDADGLTRSIEYGDLARTTTAFTYDGRRRLGTAQTYRGPPPAWSATPGEIAPPPGVGGPPSTLQLLLEDTDFAYDSVDNPTEIRDWRIADEWPAGAKPVTRKIQYDDLYRVTRIDYATAAGTDPWTSPFAAEDGGKLDPRRAAPVPHVRFDARVLWQSFKYDWLGNTTATGDDARGFLDRSLGAVSSGTASAGPYQLRAAGNVASAPGVPSREGSLTAAYDDAGNMTGLAVRRAGPCLPVGAACSQRFAYDWDEVGRLSRARRWDTDDPGSARDPAPAGPAAVELRYAYDASDARVLKTARDPAGNELHTAYPFDSLELRRTAWDAQAGDYERGARTEVPYLFAHGVRLGRVAAAEEDLPTLTSGATHVFLELMDHLGSTGIVIDRDTSELVEQSTYQGYGSADGDYRPERWKSFREDYRFTGKEEDVEVGIQYFGKRYFAPGLGRWLSADPLAIHSGGADLNAYAYVHGRIFATTDPLGLQQADAGAPLPADAGAPTEQGGSTEVAGVAAQTGKVIIPEVTVFGTVPKRAEPIAASWMRVGAGGSGAQGPGVFPNTPIGATLNFASENRGVLAPIPIVGSSVAFGEALTSASNGDNLTAAGQFASGVTQLGLDLGGLGAAATAERVGGTAAVTLDRAAASTPPAAAAAGAPGLLSKTAEIVPRAITDPGLANFVQRLEAAGIKATSVNIEMVGEGGRVLGEVDIVTKNAIIQYKNGSSSARDVIEQVVVKTEPYVSRPVVAFINDTGRAGTRTVNGAGGRILITNDFQTLVDVIQ